MSNRFTTGVSVAPLAGSGIPDAPVDNHLYGRINATWARAVAVAGDSMTGPLLLFGDPVAALGSATKQYVDAQISGVTGGGTPSSALPIMDGTAAAGVSTNWSRGDHVHPSDTSRAPLVSPVFTGIPTAPTVSPGDNTQNLATTAFVTAAVTAAGSALPSNATPIMDGTGAAGSSALYARGDHVHPSDTSKAPIASPTFTGTVTIPAGAAIAGFAPLTSPTFTGTPAGPTPAANDNTTKLATTAYVQGQASSTTPVMDGTGAVGVGTTWARADHVHPSDTSRAPLASPTFTGTVTIPAGASISGFAPLASPVFTGTPSLPTGATGITQTAGTNNTSLATTAFVAASFAPLASPVFTGTPSLPTGATGITQTAGTNNTSLATTAFVIANTASAPSSTIPLMDGTAAIGTGTTYARADHVHPSDTSRAPLASPTFTGTPAGPTAAAQTSTTQLATTAFVKTGITTAVAAPAGQIGEIIESSVAASTATLTTGTSVNVTSITLTPGDWNLYAQLTLAPAATTQITDIWSVTSTTSAPATMTPALNILRQSAGFTPGPVPVNIQYLPLAPYYIRVSSTTTVYLVAKCAFSVSTMTAGGDIWARRMC